MHKYKIGILLAALLVYGMHHAENEYSLKPTIQKSIAKAFESVASAPADVVLLESNIPLKFALGMPGDVDSLAKINGKTIKITHHVEFYGVTPILSLITGNGMFRVRLSEESHKQLQFLKKPR
jgi:hypothetical protein